MKENIFDSGTKFRFSESVDYAKIKLTMSELINNPQQRKELLKHMILQLHEGVAPSDIRRRLAELMQMIPYGEVVEVEQELILDGLPESEVLRLCDIHTSALEGSIDQTGAKTAPPGHPVDTFLMENKELEHVINKMEDMLDQVDDVIFAVGGEAYLNSVKSLLNNLSDVDKHYRRKENLLFPYFEKYGITGPPTVMWGKHNETRELLKKAREALIETYPDNTRLIASTAITYLRPAVKAVANMITKEQEILFPMALDKLTEDEWYEIYRQTNEIGYCLYDPKTEWTPEGMKIPGTVTSDENTIRLPSGSLTTSELMTILNTLPFDLTFVDKDDKVKYFTQGRERVFDRNRAIIGRDVRMCHPPASVNVVEQILSDFKSGKADNAPFWIQMRGKFIYIEYFALRNPEGEYMGTLEVSADLTEKRALTGEKRILSYKK